VRGEEGVETELAMEFQGEPSTAEAADKAARVQRQAVPGMVYLSQATHGWAEGKILVIAPAPPGRTNRYYRAVPLAPTCFAPAGQNTGTGSFAATGSSSHTTALVCGL